MRFRPSWRYPVFWLFFAGAFFFYLVQIDWFNTLQGETAIAITFVRSAKVEALVSLETAKGLGVLALKILGTVVASLWFLIRAIKSAAVWTFNQYTIGDTRIKSASGLLTRDKRDGARADFHNVRLVQNILDRLLGIGTLTLATGAGSAFTITFTKISRPRRVKQKILA